MVHHGPAWSTQVPIEEGMRIWDDVDWGLKVGSPFGCFGAILLGPEIFDAVRLDELPSTFEVMYGRRVPHVLNIFGFFGLGFGQNLQSDERSSAKREH